MNLSTPHRLFISLSLALTAIYANFITSLYATSINLASNTYGGVDPDSLRAKLESGETFIKAGTDGIEQNRISRKGDKELINAMYKPTIDAFEFDEPTKEALTQLLVLRKQVARYARSKARQATHPSPLLSRMEENAALAIFDLNIQREIGWSNYMLLRCLIDGSAYIAPMLNTKIFANKFSAAGAPLSGRQLLLVAAAVAESYSNDFNALANKMVGVRSKADTKCTLCDEDVFVRTAAILTAKQQEILRKYFEEDYHVSKRLNVSSR